MAQTATLHALAEPLLREAGLELWDVEVGRDLVRFLVERDGGVDLDALGDASRALSGLLDDHPELTPPGPYQLEISSPGLERTLRTPEQFRRFVGAVVSLKTTRPVHGARRHRGRLVGVSDGGVELDPEAAPGERLPFGFDEIDRARTVFVWEASPKPGSRRSARRADPRSATAAPALSRGPDAAHQAKDPQR